MESTLFNETLLRLSYSQVWRWRRS
jgi:hypothetical protein